MRLSFKPLHTYGALPSYAQWFPHKWAYPLLVKQIHSGHRIADPLLHPHWSDQYVDLVGMMVQESA